MEVGANLNQILLAVEVLVMQSLLYVSPSLFSVLNCVRF